MQLATYSLLPRIYLFLFSFACPKLNGLTSCLVLERMHREDQKARSARINIVYFGARPSSADLYASFRSCGGVRVRMRCNFKCNSETRELFSSDFFEFLIRTASPFVIARIIQICWRIKIRICEIIFNIINNILY